MAESRTGRRGSYAKGVAKREEILERALEVIAREGYRGASVKELADAVGLSQAGLLHYFDSKEELFTAIMRKRDEVDLAHFAPTIIETPSVAELREGYVGVIRHNSDVPGLVQLYSQMAVDAADPQHPAHEFFLERGANLRGMFASALAAHSASGEISDRADPETLARIFQAVADGLQLQWMLEPDVDMAGIVADLFDLLTQPRSDRTPE
ncbi:TetR/AcrR family transcriptional regulator [Microbacterium sp. 2FI]|uniref:TetR/AcrR family transcriptional regulator n=1 Tax=Microbacterium sp. 2FI TaxID=2502193 RepID=UPI0010F702B4|nr:TetR/AcrR family transcriptional regulator [Microbacterium sp. 2FI]